MKRLDRINRIMELLRERGNATTEFLAVSLGISESSVRRDIAYLARIPQYEGVRRVHGGLVYGKKPVEYMFELKMSVNRGLKLDLARKAAEYISDGDSITIDSGTTCYLLAQCLHERRGLRVVATDLKVAEALGLNNAIETNIISGVVRPGYYTVGGASAVEAVDRFCTEKVFMSVDSISVRQGITNASEFEVGVKRRLLQRGGRVYLLVDATKFGQNSFHRVADLAQHMVVITNRSLESAIAEDIREAGIELILV